MRKFVTVSFTEGPIPAEFADKDWPFHVTLLPSIETGEDEAALTARIAQICARHAPIEVVGESRQMFGPEHNVPVTEVSCPAELVALRDALKDGYGSDVVFTARPYPTYRPHVTDYRGSSLPVGATARLDAVSLVEKIGDRYVVACTVPLGQN
jgi:2'-5' RNA ligase